MKRNNVPKRLRTAALWRALPAALPALLAGLAMPSLACTSDHAVLGLYSQDDFFALVPAGNTLTNTDPAGCHAGWPLYVEYGASFINQAKLTIEPGGFDGPNGRGGLVVRGLFDNQRGATVINGGEFFVGEPQNVRGVLKNAGSFVNMRLLDMSGLLDNTGGLDNVGTLINAGLLANTGQLYNTGTLTTLGRLTNTGTLTNQGILNFARAPFSFSPPRFSNVGGVLENRIGAVLDFTNAQGVEADPWAGGTLTNLGTLRNVVLSTGGPGAGIVNLLSQGTVENSVLTVAAGHTQINDGRLLNTRIQVQPGGNLVNNGYSDGRADLEIGYADTTLTNTLALTVDRSTLRNGGTLVNTGGVEVKAQGRIENGFVYTDGTVAGQLQNDGVLQVAAGGRIDNLATLRSTVTLYNAGTIASTGQLDNAGRFDNVGVFTSTGGLANSGFTFNTGSFRVDGSFALGGFFINSGEVVFGAGSVTTGTGLYQQTAGATRVDGSIDIRVFSLSGGSLCGTGTINGSVVVRNGTVCPGDSPGTLHIGGNLSLTNSILEIEIAGTAPGSFDVLQVGGSLSFAGGVLSLQFADGYLPVSGAQWRFLDAAGGVTGLQTLGLEVLGLPAGYTAAIGPNGQLAVSAAPVPEPGSLALMLAGIAGLCLHGQRKGWRVWEKMRRCCSNAPFSPSPAPSAWACTVARRLS